MQTHVQKSSVSLFGKLPVTLSQIKISFSSSLPYSVFIAQVTIHKYTFTCLIPVSPIMLWALKRKSVWFIKTFTFGYCVIGT